MCGRDAGVKDRHRKVRIAMRAVVALVNKLNVLEDGQDLLEYALIVGLISIIAIVGMTAIGTTVNTVFWQAIANALAV
jgi:Flp pilus assembly pilin Flp